MKMTFNSLPRLLVLVCWLLCPLTAWAVQVKGLHQVSLPVADRSDVERKRAIYEGFQQVLVRVTGDSALLGQEVAASIATGADRYITQFGYETRPQDGSADGGIFLKMQFDANTVNNLLVRNSLPVWGSDRPPLLIWMAWEQGVDREFVNQSLLPGQVGMLQAEARRRGIVLKFPDYDDQDNQAVRLGDIWGMFAEPVLAGSQRYDSPVVLMAKVQEGAAATKINAMLQIDGKPFWFETSRAEPALALRQLMDQVVDKMGSLYAVVPRAEAGDQVLMQVEDVETLADYAGLTGYLEKLPAIDRYQFKQAQGSRVELLLVPATDLKSLEQSFRLDGRLEEMQSAGTVIHYRWRN